ncbi:multiple sugar transport system permease protein [Kribbella amoyensis]|uniref:Multiple sugar transport system permease protein n=1 Tax=Kribbella amoyensis TaxID=996641 RepID=A0A561BS43_9ACTN|nr:sugar ABC transporter permease [Kribbella amoyensis]TWD81720.1 multiple sugar transport system permease protein [Kribbella amoyensis]
MTSQAVAAPRRATAVRRFRIAEHKLAPWILLAPSVLVIVALRVIPLFLGAQYSLTGDGERNGVFVGLDNYRALLHDRVFGIALKNVGLLFLALPVAVAIPGILATFLFLKVPGHRFYRSVYFFPVVLSPVIIGAIFNILLSFDGPVNQLLGRAGLGPVDWLGNGKVAIFSVIAVHIWATFGMALVIFLAGFATLDQSLLDAARCDGANLAQTVRHVVIPELSRTIQFVFVTTMIGLLTGMFGLLYVMTAGGPGGATYLPELYIWITQGQMNSPALASAASMVLFVLMLFVGFAQLRLIKRATKEA